MDKSDCLKLLREKKLNCAEAVLKALDQENNLGISSREIQTISAFGGGVCGDMCGALCGALAAMGKTHVHECAHKSGNYVDSCREFVKFFDENMGGITCGKISELYSTEEEGCSEAVLKTLSLFKEYKKIEEKERMKVVIVGGVAGGASTAARLRRNSEMVNIVLFEKGDYISFANCGLPYYIGDVITDKEELQLQTPESFNARFNVDVRTLSEVISVDTKNKWVVVKDLKTGETYNERYDKLVLSPGAKPINPFKNTSENSNVFTLRNIPDTYAIKDFVENKKPKTCTVIGAGFIGLEVAENLVAKGIKVSIVEAANHVMAPIDPDMAHEVHNYMRSKGLNLYLSKKCKDITANSVILEDGTEIPSDMVLLSIGISPETLFLKESGIELGKRGEILVNEYMETSCSDVYALGDAVSVKNFVTGQKGIIALAGPANRQGRLVADTLCGRRRPYAGSLGTSIMKLFDMTVACTGAKEETLKDLGIDYKKSLTYSNSHAGYYPDGKMMQIKLLFSPADGKVLGAQITGTDGVDKRIDSLANAIRFGLTVYDLEEMDLAYAPPFSSAKDPVNMAGFVAENILEGKMKPFFVDEIDNIPNDAVCIDARTPEEYADGFIPGFVNIPLDTLRENLEKLDKSKKYYITCQIGLRGYLAQRIMENNGFNTKNLAGGYRFYSVTKNDK